MAETAQSPERRGREEEDHDLLTFDEAGARLRDEIAAQERLVEDFGAGPDDGELAKAVARLDGLRRAQERNARKPLNDSNFERFFGYRPDRAV